ncbi:hypothetical protein AMTRI_Chr04g250030 [Amborella trichopoda]|uniref:Uncharacterized protein n=1 Tax=Amborella trichopoda TaxID=13333 RepID=W1P4S1_AMBTC|nr:uncharacterized protein LOC18431047 [Amborella trichopoda]ERN02918.1 hypothetical protein AMTR_s00135p00077620 [Amborella trichopoda]|eukprot:XP_006841243.1 uncharacterized protein LOC18431047 [Amborella trichopoda]
MEQQTYSKEAFPEAGGLRRLTWRDTAFCSSQLVTVGEEQSQLVKKTQHGTGIVSEEEAKIRDELEIDIERDLEAEIKDDIWQLALRLNQLYRKQSDRISTQLVDSIPHVLLKEKTPVFSEVELIIKMIGGSTVEMIERKKEVSHLSSGVNHNNCRPKNKVDTKPRTTAISSERNFDWAKSLRKGTPSQPMKRNIVHDCAGPRINRSIVAYTSMTNGRESILYKKQILGSSIDEKERNGNMGKGLSKHGNINYAPHLGWKN